MKKFMISYFGGDHPSTPEEGKAHFQKYEEWLASINDYVITAMAPLKNSRTVTSNNDIAEGSATKMSGYTVVQATTIDEAVALTKNCPFLAINGTLEVAEMVEMS